MKFFVEVLGSSVQEAHGAPGVGPVEDSTDDYGTGTSLAKQG